MKNYYLATTEISEIWDTGKNLVLLGPWCLLGKNAEFLKGVSYSLVNSPWSPRNRIKDASNYCYKVCNNLIPVISEQLNIAHKVSFSTRYWRVLLGPWLLNFIGILYDRYIRVEKAFINYPDLWTYVLPRQNCDVTPFDTYDFFGKIENEIYNLKIFSILFHELYPQALAVTSFKCDPVAYSYDSFRRKFKTNIVRSITKSFFEDAKIVLTDMYHLSSIDKLFLKFKTGNRMIVFVDFHSKGELKLCSFVCNKEFRESIKINIFENKFEEFICKTLSDFIPLCFIENFDFFKDYIDTNFKINNDIKAVGSAVGWYFNECFKFFAAKATFETSAKLIEFQHGGGYQVFYSNPQGDLSLEKDYFYTWGNLSLNGRIKYLPSPHLSKIRNTHSQKNKDVIFVSTSIPKYPNKLYSYLQPDDVHKYFEDKKIFLANLTAEIRKNILYRPSYEYGWNEVSAIKQVYKDLRCLSGGNLVNEMKMARMVIVDHPNTSFLEIMTINVPCVCYWNHDVFLVREEAEEYFGLLRRAGIIFKDPITAANKINDVMGNLGEWWESAEVQNARSIFCEKFALAQKDWMRSWADELARF